MIRGTTPRLEFALPFDTEMIQEAYITFAHKRNVVFEKTLSECTCEGEKIVLKLTQKDTLALMSESVVEIQIRVLTTHGEALASNIMCAAVNRILKDGEI